MSHELVWLILGGLFVLGYAFIVLEHTTHINKSGIAVLLGVASWVIVNIYEHGSKEVGVALGHETQEIFGIVVFLLAAMTIVEILVHYQFFDWVQEKIIQRKFSRTGLFWLLGALTFIFSAFLDNLTTTLIMLQIGRKIYKNNANFLVYAANTVIAANAGGAASPIGDVTTIMLWLAGKFTAGQIITMGTLPALATWVIPQYLLGRQIKAHEAAEEAHPEIDLVPQPDRQVYWPVIGIAFLSFLFPVAANLVGLPPFIGLLAGVGLLWVFIDYKSRCGDHQHHEGRVVNAIQRADLTTLKFFIGILLAVGAMSHVGLLAFLSNAVFGANPNDMRLIAGNVGLGFLSAVLDNVPLVAAAIKMFGEGISSQIWVLLALTAGTGGSMLIVGSAAGVAAMGQVKDLTFTYYLRKATLPALLGFLGGVGVWYVIYLLMR